MLQLPIYIPTKYQPHESLPILFTESIFSRTTRVANFFFFHSSLIELALECLAGHLITNLQTPAKSIPPISKLKTIPSPSTCIHFPNHASNEVSTSQARNLRIHQRQNKRSTRISHNPLAISAGLLYLGEPASVGQTIDDSAASITCGHASSRNTATAFVAVDARVRMQHRRWEVFTYLLGAPERVYSGIWTRHARSGDAILTENRRRRSSAIRGYQDRSRRGSAARAVV